MSAEERGGPEQRLAIHWLFMIGSGSADLQVQLQGSVGASRRAGEQHQAKQQGLSSLMPAP